MLDLSPEIFHKRQVWEMADWGPDYERATLSVVEKFGEVYRVSDNWQEVIEGALLPAIHGDRFIPVRFPGPGFNLVFYPHRTSYKDEGNAVFWKVENPRFNLTNGLIGLPNFRQRLFVFENNIRLMEELMEDLNLDIDLYPPTLFIPKERFSTLTEIEIPEAA